MNIKYRRETFLNKKDKKELQKKVNQFGLEYINQVIEKKGYYHMILQSTKDVYITKKGIKVCI